jgi:hypothetical protein
VVFVAAVGKVHAHHVQTSIAELVDGLDRVCLWADGADDGSPAQVPLGLQGSVELGEPVNSAQVEVIESSSGHRDSYRSLCERMVGSGGGIRGRLVDVLVLGNNQRRGRFGGLKT